MRSAQVLLSDCIDYAGMFPPSGLDLQTTIENYASYREGPYSWALGRLILPAGSLRTFAREWPRYAAEWPVTAVVRGNIDPAASEILLNGPMRIKAVECGPLALRDIPWLAKQYERSALLFIEVDSADDVAVTLRAIAASGARAKIRTGGLTRSGVPALEDVVRFLRSCVEYRLPFKATAGLHHAIRGTHELTDEPGSERACMHGYLNVLLAAALLAKGADDRVATAVLSEERIEEFRFTDDGISWRDWTLNILEIEKLRNELAISFGSCAFLEPVQGLRAAGWIA